MGDGNEGIEREKKGDKETNPNNWEIIKGLFVREDPEAIEKEKIRQTKAVFFFFFRTGRHVITTILYTHCTLGKLSK